MDTGAVQSTQANHYSGGHKVLEVGPEFMKQLEIPSAQAATFQEPDLTRFIPVRFCIF